MTIEQSRHPIQPPTKTNRGGLLRKAFEIIHSRTKSKTKQPPDPEKERLLRELERLPDALERLFGEDVSDK